MANSINPKELQNAIMDYLENYAEDIQEDVVNTTDSVTKLAKQELIQKSPKRDVARDTKYYKGWAIKTGGRTRNNKYRYAKVIWNKTNYQLTHLLEFGHATVKGGRTKAIPHIRPVEEKYGTQFMDLLDRKIRSRSK